VDYANESYVRLYVRDTTTWKLLSWEARSVLCLLLRKVDRSGSLEVGDDGVAGVAAHIEVPIDVAERAIQQLVNPKRPILVWDGHSFVFPNFIDAQETPSSDKQRAKESRANRRAKIVEASQNVTSESRNVTQPSHAVTDGHAASQPVTLSVLSNLSDPTVEPGRPAPLVLMGPPDPKPRKQPTGPHAEVVDYFNDHYRQAYGSGATWGDKQGAMVKGLLASHSADKIRRHIANLFERPPAHLKPPFDLGTLVSNFDKLADAPRAGGVMDRRKRMT
jgi:hypothetical protein